MDQTPWTEIGSLQSDIRDLQTKVNQLPRNHELSDLDRKILNVSNQLSSLEGKIDTLTNDFESLQYNLRNLPWNGGKIGKLKKHKLYLKGYNFAAGLLLREFGSCEIIAELYNKVDESITFKAFNNFDKGIQKAIEDYNKQRKILWVKIL